MSENKEGEIDLNALEDAIGDDKDENHDISQENEDEIDLDAELDSFEPISLEGRVSEEQAMEKAIERGWREDGKDKYGHKISAIEFLERTPLFHKMELIRGDLDDVKKQNKLLVQQSKLVAKKAVEDKAKLNDELKQARENLLNNDVLDKDDITELKNIDKQIANSEPTEQSGEQGEAEYNIAKDQFVEDNQWYNNNRAMTLVADKVGVDFVKGYFDDNGVMPEPEVTFKHVLDEVQKDFPDMGKPKRQTRVSTRNNRTITQNNKSKKTLSDLPDDMQAVARNVMDAAGLSEEEYLKTYEI